MKICAPATSNPGIDLNLLDEITILYTERHTFEKLLNFCSQYSNKQINLVIKEEIPIPSLCTLNRLLEERLYIVVESLEDVVNGTVEKYDKNNLKWYLSYPIDSYIKLRWVLTTSTKYIYITDDLFYNLEQIKMRCDKQDIKLRMILNRIPSTFIFAGELKDSPIYTPEDYDFLDKYIETGEFDCWKEQKYQWNVFKVLYKRWFEKKNWNDQLFCINKDVKLDVPVPFHVKDFKEYRSNCQHRCMTSDYVKCSKCERAFQSKIF